MSIRPATPKDFEQVLRLAPQRQLNALPVRRLSAEQRQQARLARYRQYWPLLGQDPHLHILLSDDSFIILYTGTRESITGEPQGVLYDFAVPQAALVEAAADVARAAGCQYLVVDVSTGAAAEEEALAALGFTIDINRIIKRLPSPEEASPPSQEAQAYRLRVARPSDQLFVVQLNATCGPYSVPPGRNVDPAQVAQRYLGMYLQMSLQGSGNSQTFIGEHVATATPIGYGILKHGYHDEVSGEPLGYVYDVAVHPKHWGAGASEAMEWGAERWLYQQGARMFLGDISAANPRPLAWAQTKLGFVLETRRWMRSL